MKGDVTRRGPEHPITRRINREIADATLTMEQYKAQKERERLERRARQFVRDMEYRRALGLDVTAEIPKQLGSGGGTRSANTYRAIRASKRMIA